MLDFSQFCFQKSAVFVSLGCNCNSVCLHISGSRVGSEEALYLYSSGPDLTSIMPCKYGKPNGTFSKFVTEEGLRCEHVRELLMKNKDVDTTALVVSLSLHEAFTQRPHHYTLIKTETDKEMCYRHCCFICHLPSECQLC